MATWDITGIGGNTSAIAGASGTTTIQTLSATAPGDFDGNNVTLVEIFNAGSTSDQGTNDVIALTTFDMVVNGTTMSIPQSGSALATGSTASTASGTTAQWEGAAIDIGQSYTRSGKQDNDFFTISGVTVRVTYTPAVPNDPLTADDVSTSSDVSAPSVQETHVLSGSGPTSASVTGAPAVTQEHTLLSNGTASASDVSVPTATEGAGTNVLTADDVTSASDVSAPSVQETHVLAADGVFSQTTTSASSLGQGHGLAADGSTSSSEVGSPNAGQSHVILADGVSTGSDVSSPNVGEIQDFTADDTSASSSVSAPSAGQSHVASADGVTATTSVSSPSIAGSNALFANNVTAFAALLDTGGAQPSLFSATPKSIGPTQTYEIPGNSGVTLYCRPESWYIFSSSVTEPKDVFVGPDAPTTRTDQYLWIETGLGADGEGFSVWFNDPNH